MALVMMTTPLACVLLLVRITTYIDAAYCYRLSSVLCLSVCRLEMPSKTAVPIEMPFGLGTRVGPGNHVLDGGSRSPHGKGQF